MINLTQYLFEASNKALQLAKKVDLDTEESGSEVLLSDEYYDFLEAMGWKDGSGPEKVTLIPTIDELLNLINPKHILASGKYYTIVDFVIKADDEALVIPEAETDDSEYYTYDKLVKNWEENTHGVKDEIIKAIKRYK